MCQKNEYLTSQCAQTNIPDPDVKVSHNEWYAASWEMDFGKQCDEHTTPEVTNKTQKMTPQELAHTNDADTTNEVVKNQTEDTNDKDPSSPDFSNLT